VFSDSASVDAVCAVDDSDALSGSLPQAVSARVPASEIPSRVERVERRRVRGVVNIV